MQSIIPSRLLRQALVVDAAASGALAILQIVLPDALARLLMLPRALIFEAGIFMLAYTELLVVLARAPRAWRNLISLVVIGNAGWAVGCALLPLLANLAPSGLGIAFLAMQALAVLGFAALQYAGLRRSAPAGILATSGAR